MSEVKTKVPKPKMKKNLKFKGKKVRSRVSLGIVQVPRKDRGVICISHLPRGFYERQIHSFMSQFGTVTDLIVARSKKTGRSKGFAFVEFMYPEVAEIVASTMNNYLMFKKLLKCKVVNEKNIFFKNKINPSKPPKLVQRIANRRTVNDINVSEDMIDKRNFRRYEKLKKLQMKLKENGIETDILFPKITIKKKASEDSDKANKESETNLKDLISNAVPEDKSLKRKRSGEDDTTEKPSTPKEPSVFNLKKRRAEESPEMPIKASKKIKVEEDTINVRSNKISEGFTTPKSGKKIPKNAKSKGAFKSGVLNTPSNVKGTPNKSKSVLSPKNEIHNKGSKLKTPKTVNEEFSVSSRKSDKQKTPKTSEEPFELIELDNTPATTKRKPNRAGTPISIKKSLKSVKPRKSSVSSETIPEYDPDVKKTPKSSGKKSVSSKKAPGSTELKTPSSSKKNKASMKHHSTASSSTKKLDGSFKIKTPSGGDKKASDSIKRKLQLSDKKSKKLSSPISKDMGSPKTDKAFPAQNSKSSSVNVSKPNTVKTPNKSPANIKSKMLGSTPSNSSKSQKLEKNTLNSIEKNDLKTPKLIKKRLSTPKSAGNIRCLKREGKKASSFSTP